MSVKQAIPVEFRVICGVYALVDPRSSRVMYVGQAVDVERRHRQHCDPLYADGNMAKARWVAELKRVGVEPELRVLEECSTPYLDEREQHFIRHWRNLGQAELNQNPGGKVITGPSGFCLSFDDWHQLGRTIKHARAVLQDLRFKVDSATNRNDARIIDKALAAIDELKPRLEGRVARLYPDRDRKDVVSLFYGPTEAGSGVAS